MNPVHLQNPRGERLTFPSREEFALAVVRGEVREQWLVYHAAADRWLPVTEHPAFRAPRPTWAPRPPAAERSPDLVLVYPDGSIRVQKGGEVEALDRSVAEVAPLTLDEITRVLKPRPSGEQPAIPADAPGARRPGERPSNPLLDSARRAVPTFSRALSGVAALVHQR